MSDALKIEITTDPRGRGFDGMTDQQVSDDLHLANISRNHTSLTGDEVFQATDSKEFNALDDGYANNTADVKSHWLSLCGRAEIDPFAVANVQFLVSIFGNPSVTRTNLLAARVELISWVELNGIRVSRSSVEAARAA